MWMDDTERDTNLIHALCAFTGKKPSRIASEIGAAATTITRPYKGEAGTVLSRATVQKLRAKYPTFPGWNNETSDHVGMAGERIDPNEPRDELVYVREVDISLAMGDGAVVEDYPATQLVPFNMGFIRAITRASTEKLLLMTGHGDSMEPTLLRGDFLMIDASVQGPVVSDTIWAFHYAGGGMIKRLRRIRENGRDCYMIVSDNPLVPAQIAELDDIHIIGKLIWIGRRM